MFSEKEVLIKIIFIFVKSIIILSLYLHFDKRNNIKRRIIEYLAIFIFCDLYVIIDVIKELKSKSRTTHKALIIVLTVLLIANSVVGSVNTIYNKLSDVNSSSIETISKYYDRKGIEYTELENVVYYTEDGAEFKYNASKSEYVCIVNTKENKYNSRYDSLFTYIDKNGWIVFSDNLVNYKERFFFESVKISFSNTNILNKAYAISNTDTIIKKAQKV